MVDAGMRLLRERNGASYLLDTLVEAGETLYYARPIDSSSSFDYQERWLLPAPGWSVSRFRLLDGAPLRVDWYIETDLITVEDRRWTVRDAYLDVAVFDGSHYEVWDADELGDGLEAGEISAQEAVTALRSLNALLAALKRCGFSGRALLAEYAPGLPEPRI